MLMHACMGVWMCVCVCVCVIVFVQLCLRSRYGEVWRVLAERRRLGPARPKSARVHGQAGVQDCRLSHMIAIFGEIEWPAPLQATQEANRGSRRLQAGSRHGHRQCFSFANSVERPSFQGRRVPEEHCLEMKARRKDSRLSSWKAVIDVAASLAFPEQPKLCGVEPKPGLGQVVASSGQVPSFPGRVSHGFRAPNGRVGFRDGFRARISYALLGRTLGR